jgi:predicted transcriptional regulator
MRVDRAIRGFLRLCLIVSIGVDLETGLPARALEVKLIFHMRKRYHEVKVTESLYNILFEVSNEYRHTILVMLSKEPLRITEIAKNQHLTSQEISRNVSRLNEVGLTYKDVAGFYHLSPLGELTLTLLEGFGFVSRHKSYFTNHKANHLPPEYLQRLSELSGSHETKSLMDFLHYMNAIINESKESISLLVDQFPLMAIGPMVNAIKRGVKVRIIEASETTSGPSLDLASIEESEAVARIGFMPQVEQRRTKRADEFIILSESKCAITFPTRDGKFDYIGFISSDEKPLRWCNGLFQYSWENTGKGVGEEEASVKLSPSVKPLSTKLSKIVLDGKNGEGDAEAIQIAINSYNEVILRGTFELGKQSILIDRSVTVRGEGRKDGYPSTKLRKRGWAFPSTNFDSVFKIVGKDADVTIENLHFTDFNCSCIHGLLGRSLRIRNNAITLGSGYGRGWMHERFGDLVTGIWVDQSAENMGEINFDGGVTIEKNYLDFAFQPKQNMLSMIFSEPGEGEDQYLPDLSKHEYYVGIGINVLNVSGKVSINENTIMNMNGRGVSVTDSLPTSVVRISQNIIKSEERGSYPFTGDDAAFGIFVQSSSRHDGLGFEVEVEDNVLKLLKPDYCGIGVFGTPVEGKMDISLKGFMTKNKIYLVDGTAGLRIGSKSLEVEDNEIKGSAYFGVQTTWFRKPRDLAPEYGSRIKDNDVSELRIRDPFTWHGRRSVVS